MATDRTDPPAQVGVDGLLQRVAGHAAQLGRQDLAERLTARRDRTDRGLRHVLLLGEHQRGKSALVNALLGLPLCGVSATGATAVPTLIRYGSQATATVLLAGQQPADPVRRQAVPLPDASRVTLTGVDGEQRPVVAVELEVPRTLLQGGLVLVDTPGVGGGFAASAAAAALRALSLADAVLFVTDAGQELTGPEVDLLREAVALCPAAVCVLTKTDLYPHWRRILELDVEHLHAAGLDLAVIPVSAPLRALALSGKDAALAAESGIPLLVRALGRDLAARRRLEQARADVAEAGAAIRQLQEAVLAERELLTDPERRQDRVRRLEDAQQRAEQAQGASARWQQLLADEIRGLRRSVAGDLTDRFRTLRRRVAARLEDEDPRRSWDELEPWLHEATNTELAGHHRNLLTAAGAVAERVAAELALAGPEPADDPEAEPGGGDRPPELPALPERPALPDPRPAPGGPALPAPPALGDTPGGPVELIRPGTRPASPVEVGMLAARGFSLSGSVIGTLIVATLGPPLVVTLPVTATLGAVFAAFSVKSVRTSQIRQARADALRAVGAYLDQAQQDAARSDDELLDAVYRRYRDHFDARAGQLLAGARATLAAALGATGVADTAVPARLAELDRRRAALDRLAGAVAAAGAGAPAAAAAVAAAAAEAADGGRAEPW